MIAKINEEIGFWINEEVNFKGIDIAEKINYLKKYRSFLYEKRNNFFFSEWHKVSKRVLEYLDKYNVSELKISKNLADLKYNGDCSLRTDTKQSFIQIPFIDLLQKIAYKAEKYNIKITEVDESYTSKTSSLSKDINEIKELSKTKKLLTNDYNGNRVKRGLFKDKVLNKIINADLNGAKNIININEIIDFSKKINYMKYCNPIVIKNII